MKKQKNEFQAQILIQGNSLVIRFQASKFLWKRGHDVKSVLRFSIDGSPEFSQQIIKTGNGLGFTIPREVQRTQKLKAGSTVKVILHGEGELSPRGFLPFTLEERSYFFDSASFSEKDSARIKQSIVQKKGYLEFYLLKAKEIIDDNNG